MDADVCSHMSYNDAEYEYNDEGTSKIIQNDNDDSKYSEQVNFNRKLIRTIQSKPCIYAKNQIRKEPFKKIMAWKYVAKKMNISVENCKEQWTRLRLAFSRIWKVYNFNGCPDPEPKWTYFKDLEFLIPHIRFRTFSSIIGRKLYSMNITRYSSTSVSADSINAVQEWETIEIDDDDDDSKDIHQPEDFSTCKIDDENIKVKEEAEVTREMETGIHPSTLECDEKHIGPKENDLRYEEELKSAIKLCTDELNEIEEYAENDNDTIKTENTSYEEELKAAIKLCSDEVIENETCDENADGVMKIEDSDTELQEAMQCNAMSSDEYNQNEVCGEDEIEDIKHISVKCEKEAQEVMKMCTNDNDEKCEEYDFRYNNNEGCTDEENLRTDTSIPIGVKKEPEATECEKDDIVDLQIDVQIKEECQPNHPDDTNRDLVKNNTDIKKTADLTCEIGAQISTLVDNELNNDQITILKERSEGSTSEKNNAHKKKDSVNNTNKVKYTGFLSEKSTRKSDEKLLKIIKEYPVVYAADGRSIHTRMDRFYVWKEIARQTRKSVKECQERWTFLHRHLVQILKMGSKLKLARNDKKERYEKWLVKFKWFQTHMYFMEHQLLARKTIPSFEMLRSANRNMVQKEVRNECDKLSADIDNIDKIDEDSLSDHENDESILKLYITDDDITDVLKNSNGQKISSSEDIEDDDLANYKNFFS